MKGYSRRILLAVVGLSPQIVTETLYALAHTDDAFFPDEIHLVTTAVGAQLIHSKLLDEGKGYFYQLLKDYPQLGNPKLGSEQIHIVKDAQGEPLTDIRTISDNTCLANTITGLMSTLTDDEESALHVSIAGGRKTMGFYLGYVFSLFARPQDQLSHVLVNTPFENHPEFYYPTKEPKIITTQDGERICSSKAKVALAKIPVVKLRYVQPKKVFSSQKSFSTLINELQARHNPPHLHIDLDKKQIKCAQTQITLPPALLAWFCLWAKRKKQNQSAINWRDLAAEDFLALYARVVRPGSASYENAKKRLAQGISREFFRENNSKLKRSLEKQLGPAAHHYTLKSTGQRPYTKYSLELDAAEITLHLG